MNEKPEPHSDAIRIKRWALGILTTVILAGGGHAALAVKVVTELQTNQRHFLTELANIRQDIRDRTQDTYTGADASRDKALMIEMITAINKRIELAERRLDRHEDRPHKAL